MQLTENSNLTALFDDIDLNVSVTTLVVDANELPVNESPGTIYINGNVATNSLVANNQATVFTALPDSNFRFVGWLNDSNFTLHQIKFSLLKFFKILN